MPVRLIKNFTIADAKAAVTEAKKTASGPQSVSNSDHEPELTAIAKPSEAEVSHPDAFSNKSDSVVLVNDSREALDSSCEPVDSSCEITSVGLGGTQVIINGGNMSSSAGDDSTPVVLRGRALISVQTQPITPDSSGKVLNNLIQIK